MDAKLVGGKGGVFDVEIDGKVIFSKHEMSRFPEEAEILELLDGKPSRA